MRKLTLHGYQHPVEHQDIPASRRSYPKDQVQDNLHASNNNHLPFGNQKVMHMHNNSVIPTHKYVDRMFRSSDPNNKNQYIMATENDHLMNIVKKYEKHQY